MVTAMIKQLPTTMIELITHGAEMRVSTLEIEKHAGLKHQSIIKLVRKYQAKFEEQETLRFEISKSGGRPTEYALLTERHTLFLYTLFRNLTPQIINFKFNLANRFYELKEMLMQRRNVEWIAERATGKIYTKQIGELFTQAIDACGKSHNPTRYINLQQTIYKAVLGKTVQQLRKERNISKGAIIRNFLTVSELEDISAVQKIVERGFNGRSIDDDHQLTTAIINAANAIRMPFNLLIAA
jgi:phage regulator Rha-like protein